LEINDLTEDNKRVYIFRGISGSGKSTETLRIVNDELEKIGEQQVSSLEDMISHQLVAYCSADAYFMNEGVYEYDFSKIGEAHDFCLRTFLDALNTETIRLIIVDNTNTETWEYAPYTALARVFNAEIIIIEVQRDILACIKENKHRVPASAIKAQLNRYERTPPIYKTRIITVGKLPNLVTRFYRWLFRVV
jgi:hypothetical protein